MEIPEALTSIADYGVAGALVLAGIWAVLTDRIFFRREVDEWRRRYEERGEQLDIMTVHAQDAMKIATESANMLRELLIIERTRSGGTR